MSARWSLSAVLVALAVAWAQPACAFIISTDGSIGRWTSTASGPTGDLGDPATLSWSIVPDGTIIDPPFNNAPLTPSSLVSVLDDQFGGPVGTTIAERPWFPFFEDAFARFGELSGLTYVYEPNDDGLRHGSRSGVLGIRGDIRIGGISLEPFEDASINENILGYNNFPDDGDMVLDVSDQADFSNSESDFVRFRNLIMHEHGHGLGMLHVTSTTDRLLMEPFIQTQFSGPQLDEIRALHYFYGDVNEKSNGGQGNDFSALATELGMIEPGGSIAVGTDASGTTQFVAAEATDFVSIDHDTDVDFYAFELSGPSTLDAVLTPRGGVFNQGGGLFDANARVDLVLEILGEDAELFALADGELEGGVESVLELELPQAGRYYARVYGLNDTIQLYELQLSVAAPPVFLEADFNQDGDVDDVDLLGWQESFALTDGGDADGDQDSDGMDFLTWQRQFGQFPTDPAPVGASVPEPTTLVLIGLLAATAAGPARRRIRFRPPS